MIKLVVKNNDNQSREFNVIEINRGWHIKPGSNSSELMRTHISFNTLLERQEFDKFISNSYNGVNLFYQSPNSSMQSLNVIPSRPGEILEIMPSDGTYGEYSEYIGIRVNYHGDMNIGD